MSGLLPFHTRCCYVDPQVVAYRFTEIPLSLVCDGDRTFRLGSLLIGVATEFRRTGFHGGLNYYRAAEPYFYLSAALRGARITQPSFYMVGKADGLKTLYPLTVDELRTGLPGLVGSLELDNVGHWIQHEVSAEVSEQLVKFLRAVSPA